jgi:hypothetical protein
MFYLHGISSTLVSITFINIMDYKCFQLQNPCSWKQSKTHTGHRLTLTAFMTVVTKKLATADMIKNAI